MSRRLCSALAAIALAPSLHAETVSFSSDIVPLLKSRCVMCHMPGAELGELALHPRGGHSNLVGVPSTQSTLMRVEPGQPEASYLYLKLVGNHSEAGGYGERMPFGESPLGDTELELIRRWIESGAEP